MQEQEAHQSAHPIMTTIRGRPTSTVAHVPSTKGVYVACRLLTGEDAFVPLTEIFRLFEAELAAKVRMQQGGIS